MEGTLCRVFYFVWERSRIGQAQQPFTATSMIGVIALAGIVVRNSLLLMDFIIVRRTEGLSLEEAVMEAGAVRLRPILLTALAQIPTAREAPLRLQDASRGPSEQSTRKADGNDNVDPLRRRRGAVSHL